MNSSPILPIQFNSAYKTRVWGGRALEEVFKRELPEPGVRYGEAWDLVDRAEVQSTVLAGPYKGKTLNELWSNYREKLFGEGLPNTKSFPILLKILDCQKDLSLQVHPTKSSAEKHGGEPKSEMWYIINRVKGATLHVGFKSVTDRESFKNTVERGAVDELVHELQPEPGESLYLESGRIHAIGAGFLIFEIQQNSDTTYRIFDWNRVGLDGQPRDLHIEQSLDSIDFSDIRPSMNERECDLLARNELFTVSEYGCEVATELVQRDTQFFSIITIISGCVKDDSGLPYSEGDTFILPKGASPLRVVETVKYLETKISL